MLPIHYGDELGVLPTVTRVRVGRGRGTRIDPKKPGGLMLVKPDPYDEQTAKQLECCPDSCHKLVVWGRVYCPLISKAINSDRCKRMRRMSPETLRGYLERVNDELSAERRRKRQEKEARQLEVLRLVQEGQAKAKAERDKGKRGPGAQKSGGEGVLTTPGVAGPQAAQSEASARQDRWEHEPIGHRALSEGAPTAYTRR